MPPPSPPLDALIIGAGWSGLTSALQLSKAGKRVVCLEARKRIGGRAFTHSWNDDTPMDNNDRTAGGSDKGAAHTVDFGCSYIHGYDEGNPVKELAKRYGVNVFAAKPTAMQVIGANGALSMAASEKLQGNLQAAQVAAKASDATGSLSSFLLDEKQSPLFAGLTTEQDRTNAVRFSRMLHVPLGTELEQVALEHFGYEDNFAGTDGMPEGGFSRLIDLLAQEVESYGGQIKTGQVVEKVKRLGSNGGVQVQLASPTGETLDAKTAIVTVPLSVLQTKPELFEPSLGADRRTVIERTTVGNLNKVLLTYQQPWWSLDVGTFVVLPTAADAPSSPSLQDIFSSTTLIVNSLCAAHTGLPAHLTSPSLLVMVGATHAKQLERFSRIEVADALDAYLSPRLQTPSASKGSLTHTFYSRWGQQEYTRGATTTPVTLGNQPSDFGDLAKPAWDGALYFAGEHCEVNHRGSVAGAVVSAQTTSEQVLAHLDSRPT